jgi:hypothetical protein
LGRFVESPSKAQEIYDTSTIEAYAILFVRFILEVDLLLMK